MLFRNDTTAIEVRFSKKMPGDDSPPAKKLFIIISKFLLDCSIAAERWMKEPVQREEPCGRCVLAIVNLSQASAWQIGSFAFRSLYCISLLEIFLDDSRCQRHTPSSTLIDFCLQTLERSQRGTTSAGKAPFAPHRSLRAAETPEDGHWPWPASPFLTEMKQWAL